MDDDPSGTGADGTPDDGVGPGAKGTDQSATDADDGADGQTVGDLLPWDLPDRVATVDAVVAGVGVVAVVALVARLVGLGYRAAHWDEARVAHWALRYHDTDAFVYRYIIHGPLIQHVSQFLFGLFGASDLVARLPVALVGGLFPLSALLYREHLRTEELLPMAVLLAGNSVLLYYSRFIRSDILLAASAFTAAGFLVRYYDTRRGRYLLGAGVWFALAVASKENAILYALTWLGGAALLLDAALFRPRAARSGFDLAAGKLSAMRERGLLRSVLPTVGHVVGAVLVFGGVWLVMFAPRGNAAEVYPVAASEVGSVTLWEGLTNPFAFPTLVENTASYFYWEYFSWFGQSSTDSYVQKYRDKAPALFKLLATHALPTVSMALVGFLAERYARARSRNLVLFFAYGGFVSALAYPLALDITGAVAWNAAHAIVPLTVPAGVGVGVVLRWAWRAYDGETDILTTGLSALVVVVLLTNLVATAAGAVYLTPTTDENRLVQYAQPADNFRTTIEDIDTIAATNDGTDVLVYGDSYVGDTPSETRRPACLGNSGWYSALPMPWYLEASDAKTECVENSIDLTQRLQGDDAPPVIITKARNVQSVTSEVSGYDVRIRRVRTRSVKMAFVVDTDALES